MLFEDVKVLFRVKRVTASDAELAIHLTKPITRTFGLLVCIIWNTFIPSLMKN